MKNYIKYQDCNISVDFPSIWSANQFTTRLSWSHPSFDVLPDLSIPQKVMAKFLSIGGSVIRLHTKRLLLAAGQIKKQEYPACKSITATWSWRSYLWFVQSSKPALFNRYVWKLFKLVCTEAQKRDMTVSLSDYTLGIGQGFSMDEAIKHTLI